MCHAMPHWENDFLPSDLASYESVQFILRPLFGEKMIRENDDAKPTSAQTLVDRPPQAVTDAHLEFVVPDVATDSRELPRERLDYVTFVLRSMANESVVSSRAIWRRAIVAPRCHSDHKTQMKRIRYVRFGEDANAVQIHGRAATNHPPVWICTICSADAQDCVAHRTQQRLLPAFEPNRQDPRVRFQ